MQQFDVNPQNRPVFDPTVVTFLHNIHDDFVRRIRPNSLVRYETLDELPWIWRLTFHTRGLVHRDGEAPETGERHVVLVRFFPDYLRNVNRFETLQLLEPRNVFHPNISFPNICLEIYPGESLVEICESLHGLFSWRIRQLCESDALNRGACMWGRSHIDRLPVDRRPLFGRTVPMQLGPVESDQ